MDEETSFGETASSSNFEPSSVNINSRLILSAEDVPRSIRWQTNESSSSGKDTPFYHSTGSGFPRATRGILKNKHHVYNPKPVPRSKPVELWESARSYLKSDKAWLTTHSTVETKSYDAEFKCR